MLDKLLSKVKALRAPLKLGLRGLRIARFFGFGKNTELDERIEDIIRKYLAVTDYIPDMEEDDDPNEDIADKVERKKKDVDDKKVKDRLKEVKKQAKREELDLEAIAKRGEEELLKKFDEIRNTPKSTDKPKEQGFSDAEIEKAKIECFLRNGKYEVPPEGSPIWEYILSLRPPEVE